MVFGLLRIVFLFSYDVGKALAAAGGVGTFFFSECRVR